MFMVSFLFYVCIGADFVVDVSALLRRVETIFHALAVLVILFVGFELFMSCLLR